MGFAEFIYKELMKDLGNKTRPFFEEMYRSNLSPLAMPPIDMYEEGNDLVVTVDLPGFEKKDINLKIDGNVLSIHAKREPKETSGTVYHQHRPTLIDKKVLLPISISDEEKVIATATHEGGVTTLRIPQVTKSIHIR